MSANSAKRACVKASFARRGKVCSCSVPRAREPRQRCAHRDLDGRVIQDSMSSITVSIASTKSAEAPFRQQELSNTIELETLEDRVFCFLDIINLNLAQLHEDTSEHQQQLKVLIFVISGAPIKSITYADRGQSRNCASKLLANISALLLSRATSSGLVRRAE